LASFLHCALETRWQRFGQFLNHFFNDFLDDFLFENLVKILDFHKMNFLMIFNMIFSMIHKISYFQVGMSAGGVETCRLGWQFLNGL